MSIGQSSSNLAEYGQQRIYREISSGKNAFKAFSLQIFHDQVGLSSGFAEIENLNDIGMVKPSGRLCFLLKAHHFLSGSITGEHFYSHPVVHHRILTQKYGADRALADLIEPDVSVTDFWVLILH